MRVHLAQVSQTNMAQSPNKDIYMSPSPSIRSQCSTRVRACDPETAYEVFRNNTTAVEVIVKDVAKSEKRRTHSPKHGAKREETITKLDEDNHQLKNEVYRTQARLEITRRGFHAIVTELKKQLDAATKRDADMQKEMLTLRLENEKLKTMYETKSNLTNKLRKELLNVRRVLKFVMKNIFNIPQVDSFATSDPDYEDFEADLKKEYQSMRAHLAHDVLEASGATGDTTNVSKDSDLLSTKVNESMNADCMKV